MNENEAVEYREEDFWDAVFAPELTFKP